MNCAAKQLSLTSVLQRLALLACIAVSLGTAQAQAGVAQAPVLMPALVAGDEPIVVTQHELRTTAGVLRYEARAGRIAIRNVQNGEVRGHAFFVAYVVKTAGAAPRPLTFAWNGGPTSPASLLHTELLGPRRLQDGRFVDNRETLLTTSDLVFFDPIGTGFSRAARPDTEPEFLGVLGDFAATLEFIRGWRARFGAEAQPLFILGESYGSWRAGGVAQLLARAAVPLRGAMLISGGIPGSQMPDSFSDAMFVPARTAAAIHHGKLSADLMQDRVATLAAAEKWARSVYRPALARLTELDAGERDAIANTLARYIGIDAARIDRRTLVVSNREYLRSLVGGEPPQVLDALDMRLSAKRAEPAQQGRAIAAYLRHDLGYATDLAYTPLEDGYMPTPGPAAVSTGSRWDYNHREITPEMMARAQAGGGPPGSLPWLQDAMRANAQLRVFVGAGRYDSLNMCAGNDDMVATLEPALAQRFSTHCYEGGHMMYRDEPARLRLLADLRAFVQQSLPASPAAQRK